jgi:AbrB family looped-hinge helix DNA binding protein
MNRFIKEHFKLFSIGKVGPKSQVVIPAEARAELGINPGDSVVVLGFLDKMAVVIIKDEVFEEHMAHMRRHFSFLDEYENLKNKEVEFDD